MDLRRRLHRVMARQLGHPAGLAGRTVGKALNRSNRKAVTAAIDALSLPPGAVVADIGFGGGVGLGLLLDRVDGRGHVHGVEVSSQMLRSASARYRHELSAGRLTLHEAPMTELPFVAASLDGVITTNTIYFVADLDRAFAELA
jgi:arsenite methyltransferase